MDKRPWQRRGFTVVYSYGCAFPLVPLLMCRVLLFATAGACAVAPLHLSLPLFPSALLPFCP